jgi:hypothetical protein
LLEDRRKINVENLEIEIGFDAEKAVAAAYFTKTSGWREPLAVKEVATALRNVHKWKAFQEAFAILTDGVEVD